MGHLPASILILNDYASLFLELKDMIHVLTVDQFLLNQILNFISKLFIFTRENDLHSNLRYLAYQNNIFFCDNACNTLIN